CLPLLSLLSLLQCDMIKKVPWGLGLHEIARGGFCLLPDGIGIQGLLPDLRFRPDKRFEGTILLGGIEQSLCGRLKNGIDRIGHDGIFLPITLVKELTHLLSTMFRYLY